MPTAGVVYLYYCHQIFLFLMSSVHFFFLPRRHSRSNYTLMFKDVACLLSTMKVAVEKESQVQLCFHNSRKLVDNSWYVVRMSCILVLIS